MRAWIWDLHCLPELVALLERQADHHEREAAHLLALADDERQEAARVRELIAQEADMAEVEAMSGQRVRVA